MKTLMMIVTVGLLGACGVPQTDEAQGDVSESLRSDATKSDVAEYADGNDHYDKLIADGWVPDGCCKANADGSDQYTEYHPVRRGERCFKRETLCTPNTCLSGIWPFRAKNTGTLVEKETEVKCP